MGLHRQILLLSVLLTGAAAAPAETTPDLTRGKVIVPDEIPGVKTLTAEGLIEKANNIEGLIIIDSRISKDRAIGYIEDSVSLPDINTNCDTLSELVKNKQTPLLFYCNGVKCGRSVVAVKIAKSCGYTNLSWFRGGFEEWQEKGYQYMTQDKLDSN
jgi:rhodanese-related sulfurtransferase